MTRHKLLQYLFRPSNINSKPISCLICLLTLIYILFLNNVAFAIETPDWDKLVRVVIQVESGGDPHAVGSNNDVGLMQITPIVLKEYNQNKKLYNLGYYSIGHLYNPSINVKIGTWYLKRLYHYYKCSTIEQIAMSYNGGITRARKNGFDLKKMPKSTQRYVKRVIKLYYKGGVK